MKKTLFFSLTIATAFLLGKEDEPVLFEEHPEPKYIPWLTGPLLVPTGYVTPRGHFNLEPFLFVTSFFGDYDGHWHPVSRKDPLLSVNPQLFVQVGLTEWMDLESTPQMFYNHIDGASSTHFGDFPLGVDFQLVQENDDKGIPSVKFQLEESFPTGKYQHLNPRKKGTDGVGAGAFITSPTLVITRILHIKKHHFLVVHLSGTYNIPSPTHVKGLTVYGGGKGTHGKVYLGQSINAFFSLEYTFNQRWVFSIDSEYTHANKTRFSGHSNGNPVGLPSSEQCVLAPALEYNMSPTMGLIAGSWFTVAGRNTPQLAGGVIAFNYFH